MAHFYTYFTQPEKATYLLESAKFHGITVTNLWDGKPWEGLWNKFQRMEETIRDFPEDDIVCFLDAYDLIVNADANKIIDTFVKSKSDILFGAETNLDPVDIGKERYPNSPTIFRFLNSGVYVGYVRAIKKMLHFKNYVGENDQKHSHLYFLEKGAENNINLDYNSNLVVNMYGVPWQELQIMNGSIHYIPFRNEPCIVHFNGMSYLDIDKDYIRNGNQLQFIYNAVYDRLLCALHASKILTKSADIVCIPTGRGSTY